MLIPGENNMHATGGSRFVAATTRGTRRLRRATLWGAVAAVAALAFGGIAVPVASADTAPAAGTPETYTADALPTVQIDGSVYAQEVVGNTVYVGGSFAKARPAGSPAGSNETARANLLAYDLTTGALISSWNPGTNGTVLDIKKSPDGSRIYVAGMFSQAAGAWRYRVAAFDTTTGALVTSWAPAANGRIDGIAVTGSTVYLAGEFTTINGAQRTKVAAVSSSTGALTGFTADVQGGYGAKAVVVSPDTSKVVVAGSFTSVNGSTNPGRGITALNASTGAIMPWAMNSVVRNGDISAVIYSLSSDGESIYGTGTAYKTRPAGVLEGAFRANWSDGSLQWIEDCGGDTYDVAPVGDAIYVVGHPYDCTSVGGFPYTGPFKNSLAFSKAPTAKRTFGGTAAAPSLLHWFPDWTPGTYTGQSQGPWQITGAGDYLLAGGEFLKVNGTAQQGIVRFAKKSVAANKQGPQVQGGAWTLTAAPSKEGNLLSWSANHDRDSQGLRYQVFRQDKGMTTPLYETDQLSNFWTRPAMSYRDSTAVPGTPYKYRIKAIDSTGNTTQGDWTPVTTDPDGIPPNQAPNAAFTPTLTGLSVAVDGSASKDADGAIQAYAWNFGDGGIATGATASRTYAAAGTYSVTLTVTDDRGGSTAITQQVTVARPAAAPVVSDTFTRTVAVGGWGLPDLGGAWTHSGGSAAFSVADGKGSVSLTPSATRTARLGLSTTDATIRVSVAADAVATGGAATATVIGRHVGTFSYSARLRFEVGGGVRLYLLRDEVALGSYLMSGVTYTPGTALTVAVSVTGTSPTTLAAKVWRTAETEPVTWQVSASDSTPAMQSAGTVGLSNTVSAASSLHSTTFTWDDLHIVTP